MGQKLNNLKCFECSSNFEPKVEYSSSFIFNFGQKIEEYSTLGPMLKNSLITLQYILLLIRYILLCSTKQVFNVQFVYFYSAVFCRYIKTLSLIYFHYGALDLFQLQTTFWNYLMPIKDTPFCVVYVKYISVLQYIKHISHRQHGPDNLIIGLRNDYFYIFLSKIGSNHVTLILGFQINLFTE